MKAKCDDTGNVTIVMDLREAMVMMGVARHIGGLPGGPRGVFSDNPNSLLQTVREAVEDVYPNVKLQDMFEEMENVEGHEDAPNDPIEGSISFDNTWTAYNELVSKIRSVNKNEFKKITAEMLRAGLSAWNAAIVRDPSGSTDYTHCEAAARRAMRIVEKKGG
jgi:hypothetical protein